MVVSSVVLEGCFIYWPFFFSWLMFIICKSNTRSTLQPVKFWQSSGKSFASSFLLSWFILARDSQLLYLEFWAEHLAEISRKKCLRRLWHTASTWCCCYPWVHGANKWQRVWLISEPHSPTIRFRAFGKNSKPTFPNRHLDHLDVSCTFLSLEPCLILRGPMYIGVQLVKVSSQVPALWDREWEAWTLNNVSSNGTWSLAIAWQPKRWWPDGALVSVICTPLRSTGNEKTKSNTWQTYVASPMAMQRFPIS